MRISLGYKFAWYNVENKNEKNVAITFDDGPHGTLTPRLLDELNKVNFDDWLMDGWMDGLID